MMRPPKSSIVASLTPLSAFGCHSQATTWDLCMSGIILTHSPILASYQIIFPYLLPQTTYWLLGEMQNLVLVEPNLKSSCSKLWINFYVPISQIFIVSSFVVETIYFSSGVILTQDTGSAWASSSFMIESFDFACQTLMLQSLWPETI